MNAPFQRRGGRRPENPRLPMLTPARRRWGPLLYFTLGLLGGALAFLLGLLLGLLW